MSIERRRTRRPRYPLAVLTVALGLTLVGACGSGSDEAAPGEAAPATEPTADTSTSEPAASAGDDGGDAAAAPTPTTNPVGDSNAEGSSTPAVDEEQAEWPSAAALPTGLTITPSGGSEYAVTSTEPTAFDSLYAWAESIGTIDTYGGDNEYGGRITVITTRPELTELNGSEISSDTTVDIMVASPTEATILIYCTPATGREC